jgi:large subunit ribosomal protein L23
MATTSILKKGPKLGRKEIFLYSPLSLSHYFPPANEKISRPNFTLTLLRTPELPPTFASFYVPLKLNKLDLRDYLWNCYGVSVLSVRSYIQMQKVRQGKPGDKVVNPRRWFRPRSIKKMTVEMDKPFVWPEVPDLEMWDKKVYDGTQKEREEREKDMQHNASMNPPRDRTRIAEQAKSLLKGQDAWKTGNSNPQWVEGEEEVEVETDVQLPKIER